jgi:hypothetical protein
MTVEEIAKRAGTSIATVQRYAAKVRAQQYQDENPDLERPPMEDPEVLRRFLHIRDQLILFASKEALADLRQRCKVGGDVRGAALSINTLVQRATDLHRLARQERLATMATESTADRENARTLLLHEAAARGDVRAAVELAKAWHLDEEQLREIKIQLLDIDGTNITDRTTPSSEGDPTLN